MSIKCGSCKNRHETIAQVRLCYARKNGEAATVQEPLPTVEDWAAMKQQAASREAEQERQAYIGKMERDEEMLAAARLDAMTGSSPRELASAAQVSYIMDMLLTREWPDNLTAESVRSMERRQASKLIDSLKRAPVKKAGRGEESPIPDVPAGRYAVYLARGGPQENDHELLFVQVDKPNEGKWAGRTFVNQLIGAPGDYRRQRMSAMKEARVMTRIAANPEEAALRYGKESGVCGVCRSPLTNENSLARGIGPICAGKTGWGA